MLDGWEKCKLKRSPAMQVLRLRTKQVLPSGVQGCNGVWRQRLYDHVPAALG